LRFIRQAIGDEAVAFDYDAIKTGDLIRREITKIKSRTCSNKYGLNFYTLSL